MVEKYLEYLFSCRNEGDIWNLQNRPYTHEEWKSLGEPMQGGIPGITEQKSLWLIWKGKYEPTLVSVCSSPEEVEKIKEQVGNYQVFENKININSLIYPLINSFYFRIIIDKEILEGESLESCYFSGVDTIQRDYSGKELYFIIKASSFSEAIEKAKDYWGEIKDNLKEKYPYLDEKIMNTAFCRYPEYDVKTGEILADSLEEIKEEYRDKVKIKINGKD